MKRLRLAGWFSVFVTLASYLALKADVAGSVLLGLFCFFLF